MGLNYSRHFKYHNSIEFDCSLIFYFSEMQIVFCQNVFAATVCKFHIPLNDLTARVYFGFFLFHSGTFLHLGDLFKGGRQFAFGFCNTVCSTSTHLHLNCCRCCCCCSVDKSSRDSNPAGDSSLLTGAGLVCYTLDFSLLFFLSSEFVCASQFAFSIFFCFHTFDSATHTHVLFPIRPSFSFLIKRRSNAHFFQMGNLLVQFIKKLVYCCSTNIWLHFFGSVHFNNLGRFHFYSCVHFFRSLFFHIGSSNF